MIRALQDGHPATKMAILMLGAGPAGAFTVIAARPVMDLGMME
jgi:hypothetical protein